MRKQIYAILSIVVSLAAPFAARANNTVDYSVQVSATVQPSPAQITLAWPQDTISIPKNYTVYRRAPGASSWGTGTSLPGNTTTYVDRNVAAGTPYEYQIVKTSGKCTGYGYIYAGINAPLTEHRGRLLLVVDNTCAAELATELARLQQDLVGDGWTVTRLGVNRGDSPAQVKSLIKAQYDTDPADTKAVFLFGHVPVPYSGDIVPDGHYSNHQGAWPCDGYYADMDGTWTDHSVNNTTAADPRNHNVPGDGKFDQSQFPAPLKLMVGRVDLANMPGRMSAGGPATFPSELELLRNYLNKDHNFRNKVLTAPERGIVGDYFGARDGEAFAASGFRNFAPFFGAAKTTTLTNKGSWIPELSRNAYLWAYGCGSGSYTSIEGIGSVGQYEDGVTTELVQNDVKAIFTMLYGSWLGDWDSEDNIQRAVLATPDYGLTCAWSGRPHWFMHHMALGQPIGFSTRVTQNDGFNGFYKNQQNNCASWTHIALMGDPTLRMQVVAPPSNVNAAQTGKGIGLSWTPANDSIEGYHIYRATDPNGPFTRVNQSLVTGTSYTDATVAAGNYTYMVRAVKLETSGSGTYFNPSQGAIASIGGTPATLAGVGRVSPSAPNAAEKRLTPTDTKHGALGETRPTTPPANGRTLPPTGVTNGAGGIDTIWFDDSLPNGAQSGADGGDSWNWTSSNPAPYSGPRAHQSSIAPGFHQHYFAWAWNAALTVASSETLFAYVYIDPANVPSEIMLNWFDGSWEHRAYWGANNLNFGVNGTASRRYMGPLPTAGGWVRLEVPASQVGIGSRPVIGMAFQLYGGRATWDYVGKSVPNPNPGGGTTPPPTTPPAVNVTNTVWFDDTLPAGAAPGADGGDAWTWTGSSPAPFSGSAAHQSAIASGFHQHYFAWAWNSSLTVKSGEVLFAYVYLDPANVPSQIMLNWADPGGWEHRAYWGANNLTFGVNGTASRRYMGPLPAAGQWVRLEVPASQVDLEGKTLIGMAFQLHGGRATWDYAGKANALAGSGSTGGGDTGGTTNTNSTITITNDVKWVDDALPTRAITGADGGDNWTWTANSPTPQSGLLAHPSGTSSGFHQHYFAWATQTLPILAGEVLYAYVYLDPANVPAEVMLNWFDGSWEHRAYWGANNLNFGANGTASRRYMGPLPPAGQWVRLQVPASQVGLEGRTLNGMAFQLFGGRATWDNAGKASIVTTNSSGGTGGIIPPVVTNPPPVVTNPPPVVTNPPPIVTNPPPVVTNPPATNIIPSTNVLTTISNLFGATAADNIALQLPAPGTYALRVLTPTLLELKLINTKNADPARVTEWDLVNTSYQFAVPPVNAFVVTANGQPVGVQSVGFKRRPMYAPLIKRDLRIENSLYVKLTAPISDNQTIQVTNPNGTLWANGTQMATKMDPLRYSPAIHVNQEGYMPNYAKKAMVGYYTGNLGEMTVPASSGFKLVDAVTGTTVHQGSLIQRADVGWAYSPTPYQQVYEADFTGFNTPGQYRLVVPGLGASLPFSINEGVAMAFARAYALGMYHQRCGTNCALPYTRYTHDVCHAAPASVPSDAAAYPFTWTKVAEYANTINQNNPSQVAPALTSPAAQLFPFVRQGALDTSGGHHDAGDYSKYTLNSAALIHYLMFAADAFPGVATLDNLGIPESGDGISDVLQEAKWEADFLARIQDTDGGFYFLVYPKNREYEGDVTPDHGDPQVVWPKTSSATAASVAALAQCASSPLMKQKYPQAAAMYLAKAKLGWQFLMNAIAQRGKNGIYQKITHYGDDYTDKDELIWAACEMYLATGDPQIQQTLFQWFPDPTDPATFHWGWWRQYLYYGNAVRSYAFAVKSGRLSASQIDANYLAKCNTTIVGAGDDTTRRSKQSAYGTSFPEETKRYNSAGWYISGDQAFDIATAYQVDPKPDYLTAIVANMNYEGGCNPVNVSYVSGLGWKRQRDVVNQYALNDRRLSPPSGQPSGNIQNGFAYLWWYGGELAGLNFPQDSATPGPYPFYDRWGDSWNVSAEFVTFQSARCFASYAFLAAQSSLKTQPWKAVTGTIVVPPGTAPIGAPLTLKLQAPGIDLTGARVVWEVQNQDPAMVIGPNYTFAPKNNGTQWVEAEAQLTDGRRIFATASFNANSPNIVWVDDAVPAGAATGTEGGDTWTWANSNPSPVSGTLTHPSASAAGVHQHYFQNAAATMTVSTGSILYAWVYLDPANPPSQIMLAWNNGNWSHGAYWGANSIPYGSDGTDSRRYMGPLPAAGGWVQLKVPASQVGLEGSVVNGMGFILFNGRAIWDAAGALNPNVGPTPPTNLTINVTATDASRAANTAGAFTLTREGDASTPLVVNYTLGGTAAGGADYKIPPELAGALSGTSPSVTIPAGATSVTLNITPMMTTNIAGDETLTLALADDPNYDLGSSPNANVNITGNAVPLSSAILKAKGAILTWPALPRGYYQVACKTNLNDPNWTVIKKSLKASKQSARWTDLKGGTNRIARTYLVIRTK